MALYNTLGLLLSLDQSHLYVSQPEGGLRAVEIATGEARWTSSADLPLATDGRVIIAVDEQLLPPGRATPDTPPVSLRSLTIVVLDATTGKTLRTCGSDTLPPWAAGLAAGDGTHTLITAQLHGRALSVERSSNTWYTGGAPPPPEIQAAASRSDVHRWRCDLSTGAITPLREMPPAPLAPPRWNIYRTADSDGRLRATAGLPSSTMALLPFVPNLIDASSTLDGQYALLFVADPADRGKLPQDLPRHVQVWAPSPTGWRDIGHLTVPAAFGAFWITPTSAISVAGSYSYASPPAPLTVEIYPLAPPPPRDGALLPLTAPTARVPLRDFADHTPPKP